MKARTVVLKTALAGALAAASAVHAVDSKVFSSAACQATFGFQAAETYNFFGYFQNVSPYQNTVVCPIVRDNHTNLNGVKDAGVSVRSPQGTTLSCSLTSFTTLGYIVESDTKSTPAKRLPICPWISMPAPTAAPTASCAISRRVARSMGIA